MKRKIYQNNKTRCNYFQGSMYEHIQQTAKKYPYRKALKFVNKSITFNQLLSQIDTCACAFSSIGIRPDDYVTIVCPNCIEAVVAIYATNKIGAICNMVHPLSSAPELKYYLNGVDSTTIVILDMFYKNFEQIRNETNVERAIVVNIADDLSPILKIAYNFKTFGQRGKVNNDNKTISWRKLLKLGHKSSNIPNAKVDKNDTACVLYSGGTTSKPKGIELTNFNFNALVQQILVCEPSYHGEGANILGIMPLFHGFGLGLFTHALLANGATCILVARFNPKSFERTLYKEKCNYIAGVPALFEKWMNMENIDKHDYSFLKGIFCGGDKLTYAAKTNIDEFLKQHNCSTEVREGYGLTETVTCCCLMPKGEYAKDSIGKPLPDTYMKIGDKNTLEEMPNGQEGEIVVRGPLVMKGYINNESETAEVLKKHSDGHIWLHTGDAGSQDANGYFYFKGRYKRVIITSGYTVFPNALEEVIDTNELVEKSCVVGVPDKQRGEKIKVFIELKKHVVANEKTKEKILNFCHANIGKHQMPREVQFIDKLPTTKVGKIDYKQLS